MGYDIKYVVNGGSEKNVPESIVHAVEELSSSRRHPKARVKNKRKLDDTEQPDPSSSSSSALPATLKPEKKNVVKKRRRNAPETTISNSTSEVTPVIPNTTGSTDAPGESNKNQEKVTPAQQMV